MTRLRRLSREPDRLFNWAETVLVRSFLLVEIVRHLFFHR
jgi:hypothetical protein